MNSVELFAVWLGGGSAVASLLLIASALTRIAHALEQRSTKS